MPLTAHEACRVADDWTQSLLPRPPQPAQPSSGQSIRDSWPFSAFCCFIGMAKGKERRIEVFWKEKGCCFFLSLPSTLNKNQKKLCDLGS